MQNQKLISIHHSAKENGVFLVNTELPIYS